MTRTELNTIVAGFPTVRIVSVDESRPGSVFINLRASIAEVRDVQSAIDAARDLGVAIVARVDPEIAADRAARTPEAIAAREARAAEKAARAAEREAARAAVEADPERQAQRQRRRERAARG